MRASIDNDRYRPCCQTVITYNVLIPAVLTDYSPKTNRLLDARMLLFYSYPFMHL